MPLEKEIKDALLKEGWPGLILIAYGGVIGCVYVLFFGFGGAEEKMKFRNDCWNRESRYYLPGDVPKESQLRIVSKCEKELRAHLGLKP
jgi:hypothetical protein